MKKTLLYFCVTILLGGIVSCGGDKKRSSLYDLSGEWDIIEVENMAVVVDSDEIAPFLGFSPREKQIYGYCGCNRLMGSFDFNEQRGTIDLTQTGSTRMLCPDMELEDRIMKAMGEIKKYKTQEDRLLLCNETGRTLMVLKRREKK